jgi:asparagine synthase (glutamine-hydrolysing)
MCGICGVICSPGNFVQPQTLGRMSDSLAHRGPDDSGIQISGSVGFGFRRLAILDLSPAGHQPMWDRAQRAMLVFNGEIYNYLELREDLKAQGVTFETATDSEVLLQMYLTHGERALSRLNGMFAFAIYDKRDGTVLLARDRLGVKPLFYWQNTQGIAFASEICALRQLPGFPRQLDPLALGCFFRLGTTPEWTCIYPGLRKLPPGSWLRIRVSDNKVEGPKTYWNLPDVEEEEGISEESWLDRIDALLNDATRIRLRSDVPLGVFLSGGIDSSLVAAMAKRQQAPLASITIGFNEQTFDETPMAMSVARHLGLDSAKRLLDLPEARRLLPSVMGHFDEPFGDKSALPTSLVCAEARKSFTVMLSGDGGDETFGGYLNHVRAWRWRHIDRLPRPVRRFASHCLTAISQRDSKLCRLANRLPEDVGRFGLGGQSYVFQGWLEKLLRTEFSLSPRKLISLYAEHLGVWPSASSIDLAQRTDLRHYLVEDILVKVDRMSMRHALEVRSPFLDYRIVELALRIPSRLRVKNGTSKYLLRRLAKRYLPESVCHAPKRGFAIPLNDWLYHSSASAEFHKVLVQPDPHFVEPFLPGACEHLWELARRNSSVTASIFNILAYRWWCARQN